MYGVFPHMLRVFNTCTGNLKSSGTATAAVAASCCSSGDLLCHCQS